MIIEDSIFLLIDIQEKLVNAAFNKDEIINKSKILAEVSNVLNIPVLITEQYPKGLGFTIDEVSEKINLKSKYFEKITFDALENNELFNYLKKSGRKNIILFGIETHICVYQTAKALVNNGYNITIIKDACGSRAEIEHISALENLKQINCNIKTTEMVIFEFLKSAKHPSFKEIQNLIK